MSLKKTHRSTRVLSSIMIGIVVSVLACLGGALIGSMLVIKGIVKDNSIMIIANIIQGVGVLLGVLCSGYLVDEKKWVSAVFCAGSFFMVLVTCATLFFTLDGMAIINCLLSFIIGMSLGLIIIYKGVNRTKTKRFKRRSRYVVQKSHNR